MHNVDTSQTFKDKMSVDIPKDLSIVVIFLFPYIAIPILIPLGSYCSACEVLNYIVFYLSYIALILQDRTAIEITQDTITINRFLFGPWVINKKDIIRTEVKKNFFHTIRFPSYIFMLFFLLFNIKNAYNGIHVAIIRDYPTEGLLLRFLSRTLIIIFLCVLFYLMETRLKISDVLEVNTHDKKYKFYTPDPEEFRKLLAINMHRSENDPGK